jgi:hypothetical protein
VREILSFFSRFLSNEISQIHDTWMQTHGERRGTETKVLRKTGSCRKRAQMRRASEFGVRRYRAAEKCPSLASLSQD